MSSIKIRAALETALDAIAPAMATAWENDGYTPSGTIPYQEVFMMFGEPENPSMGPGFHREVGTFQVSLRYPIPTAAGGGGPALAQTRAELIRSAFPRGASFTNGGVTVSIEHTPWIGPAYLDADRYVVPVRIRFFANIFE